MDLNEELITKWLHQVYEWNRDDVPRQCFLGMTDALNQLKNFLAELDKVLTKLVCILNAFN